MDIWLTRCVRASLPYVANSAYDSYEVVFTLDVVVMVSSLGVGSSLTTCYEFPTAELTMGSLRESSIGCMLCAFGNEMTSISPRSNRCLFGVRKLPCSEILSCFLLSPRHDTYIPISRIHFNLR